MFYTTHIRYKVCFPNAVVRNSSYKVNGPILRRHSRWLNTIVRMQEQPRQNSVQVEKKRTKGCVEWELIRTRSRSNFIFKSSARLNETRCCSRRSCSVASFSRFSLGFADIEACVATDVIKVSTSSVQPDWLKKKRKEKEGKKKKKKKIVGLGTIDLIRGNRDDPWTIGRRVSPRRGHRSSRTRPVEKLVVSAMLPVSARGTVSRVP